MHSNNINVILIIMIKIQVLIRPNQTVNFIKHSRGLNL